MLKMLTSIFFDNIEIISRQLHFFCAYQLSCFVQQVINGDGIDRHLLGLKLIAIENGANVPDLFMDTAFTSCTHFRLSTSQVML